MEGCHFGIIPLWIALIIIALLVVELYGCAIGGGRYGNIFAH